MTNTGGTHVVLQADDEHLHDWGGVSVCFVIIKQPGGKEARFSVRVRIPDDPRGGVEGSAYCEVSALHRTRDVSKEVRGQWVKFD